MKTVNTASNSYTEDQLYLLAMSSTPGIGPATINALTNAAHNAEIGLRDLLATGVDELSRRSGISDRQADRIATIQAPLKRARKTLDLLRKTDLYPIFRGDPAYPDNLSYFLGTAAPAVLFIGGDIATLSSPSLGIVGSRRPHKKTLRAAFDLAISQARAGVTIVSGGARGIDTGGHQGAIKGGCTAVVPPAGAATYRWRGIDRTRLRSDQWCVIGQFPPLDPWRTCNALQRNHTIVALSDAVVGFEPRDEGGTWRSCRETLRQRKPLFVVNASPKNDRQRGQDYFVNRGAVALSPEHMPSPEDFRHLIAEYSPPSTRCQNDLFN